MGDVFSNGVSGLLAFQRAINTTAHNIANVNTEGYSRQRAELAARAPEAYSNGFLGNGVQVTSTVRLFDQSRQAAVQTSSSEHQRLTTLAEYAGRTNNLLADQTAGLSPSLQSFFDKVQDVATDPSSVPARETLFSAGQNLVSRLHSLDNQLAQFGAQVEQQLQGQVKQVNHLADEIAQLNESIVTAQASAGGQPANDLLDQRDSLILKLSALVSTQTVAGEKGSVDVFVGNGQMLVGQFSANRVQTLPGRSDRTISEIAITRSDGTPVNITSNIRGGSLGGMLDFRREVLEPTSDRLGLIATSVAEAVNNQNRLGMHYADTPTGQLGGDIFQVAQPQVLTDQGTVGKPAAGIARLDPSAVGELTGANYRLSYDGSGWTLSNLSTDTATAINSIPQSVDGLLIDVSKVSGAAAGDSFLVRPTRGGAGGIGMAITRASEIATAAPVRVAQATNASGTPQNQGTGEIGEVRVSSTASLPLNSAYTLTFDASNNRFLVNGNTSATIAYNPSTDSNGVARSVPGLGGVQFTLAGQPSDGDQFLIENNNNAVGDNSNILELGKLADTGILDGGKATFQESYSGLVSDVGTATLRANANRDAQESVLNQAQAARDALSGVNLDEEAANLLKYQQAYQASAQAISIANTLFDSLLAAVRG